MVLVATMRGDEASRHRSDRPEAHGRGPAQLGAEVAHQGRGGHQDGPLDDAEGRDDDEELHSVVHAGTPTATSRPTMSRP